MMTSPSVAAPTSTPPRRTGRRTDRIKARDCMWLDIEMLIRQGIVIPGAHQKGVIGWRSNFTCDQIPYDRLHSANFDRDYICTVDYDANFVHPPAGSVRFRYRVCDPMTGKQRVVEHDVAIAKNWGKWWFIDHGRLCRRLCLPPLADRFGSPQPRFASPQAWGVRFANLKRAARRPTRIRRPAEHSDPHAPPNAASGATTAGRHVRPQGHETALIPATKDPEKDHEHMAAKCAPAPRWAWLLAKAAVVPRAFADIRRRENGQDRRSAKCAKAKRGTWFRTKIIAARDASKKCVTGVRLQRFWQAMVVSPVRTIMRPFLRVSGNLLTRWKRKERAMWHSS